MTVTKKLRGLDADQQPIGHLTKSGATKLQSANMRPNLAEIRTTYGQFNQRKSYSLCREQLHMMHLACQTAAAVMFYGIKYSVKRYNNVIEA